MQETRVQSLGQEESLGQEDPLEEEMATHSSILAWEILWAEKPGGVQSMGSQRVEHDLAIKQLTKKEMLQNLGNSYQSLCKGIVGPVFILLCAFQVSMIEMY